MHETARVLPQINFSIRPTERGKWIDEDAQWVRGVADALPRHSHQADDDRFLRVLHKICEGHGAENSRRLLCWYVSTHGRERPCVAAWIKNQAQDAYLAFSAADLESIDSEVADIERRTLEQGESPPPESAHETQSLADFERFHVDVDAFKRSKVMQDNDPPPRANQVNSAVTAAATRPRDPRHRRVQLGRFGRCMRTVLYPLRWLHERQIHRSNLMQGQGTLKNVPGYVHACDALRHARSRLFLNPLNSALTQEVMKLTAEVADWAQIGQVACADEGTAAGIRWHDEPFQDIIDLRHLSDAAQGVVHTRNLSRDPLMAHHLDRSAIDGVRPAPSHDAITRLQRGVEWLFNALEPRKALPIDLEGLSEFVRTNSAMLDDEAVQMTRDAFADGQTSNAIEFKIKDTLASLITIPSSEPGRVQPILLLDGASNRLGQLKAFLYMVGLGNGAIPRAHRLASLLVKYFETVGNCRPMAIMGFSFGGAKAICVGRQLELETYAFNPMSLSREIAGAWGALPEQVNGTRIQPVVVRSDGDIASDGRLARALISLGVWTGVPGEIYTLRPRPHGDLAFFQDDLNCILHHPDMQQDGAHERAYCIDDSADPPADGSIQLRDR